MRRSQMQALPPSCITWSLEIFSEYRAAKPLRRAGTLEPLFNYRQRAVAKGRRSRNPINSRACIQVK